MQFMVVPYRTRTGPHTFAYISRLLEREDREMILYNVLVTSDTYVVPIAHSICSTKRTRKRNVQQLHQIQTVLYLVLRCRMQPGAGCYIC